MTVPSPPGSAVDVNLASVDAFMSADVDAVFRALRAQRPIAWHEHPDSGRGFWSLTRHTDIRAAAKDTETFSSAPGIRLGFDAEEEAKSLAAHTIIRLDPPTHTSFRRLVWAPFSPRRVSQLRDDIHARCRSIVDEVYEARECEFVFDISEKLPMSVTCDVLGIPDPDRKTLADAVNKVFGSSDPGADIPLTQVFEGVAWMRDYAHHLIEERTASPQSDLLSDLTQVEIDGETLSADDIVSFFMIILAGGIETARNTLSHAIDLFDRFPDQRALLLENPKEHAKLAIEEVLRWATPVENQKRTVTRDTQFGGVQMHEGDKVALWFRSGNRDSAVFADPDAFDITRSPNDHMSFGGNGPHFCLGAQLARLELQTMLTEIYERMPDIRPTGPPEMLRSISFHGVKKMDVSW